MNYLLAISAGLAVMEGVMLLNGLGRLIPVVSWSPTADWSPDMMASFDFGTAVALSLILLIRVNSVYKN
jgi:hypothetical protein